MKHYFSMTNTNVNYFIAYSVQTLHRASPEQKRVSTTEKSRRGGRCTLVSSMMMGAAAPMVSGTTVVTRKWSQGWRHQGQSPAMSGSVEDGDRAQWSGWCRVRPGRRVRDGDRATVQWSRRCRRWPRDSTTAMAEEKAVPRQRRSGAWSFGRGNGGIPANFGGLAV
jgi:hypothetical protein